MTTIRCKFICQSKRQFLSGIETCYDYAFTAVSGNSEENKKFWKWTPSGQLNVSTVFNDQFIPGKNYYIDIVECE